MKSSASRPLYNSCCTVPCSLHDAEATHLAADDCGAIRPSLRLLQLNTLAHWAVDGESDEAYRQRVALHTSHIQAMNPSIVVLEEVDGPQTLPSGVTSVAQQILRLPFSPDATAADVTGPFQYRGVHGAKPNEKGDQTWILYEDSRFTLEHSEVIPLGGEGESQFAVTAVLRVADRANVAILIVGMHAKAGRTEDHETTRIRQTTNLSLRLQGDPLYRELISSGRCVLVGDFNAGPHSYEGLYPSRWYDMCVTNPEGPLGYLGFVSAYGEWLRSQNGTTPGSTSEPPFTTIKWRNGALISQCIDYIFFTKRVSDADHPLSLRGVVPLPQMADIPQETALPAAGIWASDHLSLICDFDL